MIFKLGICDDEYLFRQKVKKYCEEIFSLKLHDYDLIEYASGDELINSEEKLDLLFLDIEMGETNGMDVKRYFEDNNINTRIVFLTNHSKMMKQAFGKNVFGFLDKCNYEAELSEIVDKVLVEIQNNEVWEIEDNEKELYIRTNEIIYMKANGVYVDIVTKDKRYCKRSSIKECETLFLEKGFYRTHKSFLINFKHLKSVTKKSVNMSDGTELKISRGAWKSVKEQYVIYIQKRI